MGISRNIRIASEMHSFPGKPVLPIQWLIDKSAFLIKQSMAIIGYLGDTNTTHTWIETETWRTKIYTVTE